MGEEVEKLVEELRADAVRIGKKQGIDKELLSLWRAADALERVERERDEALERQEQARDDACKAIGGMHAARAQVEAMRKALELISIGHGATWEDTVFHARKTAQDALRALSALASSTPESGVYPDWRPIETAEPADNKALLVATADEPPVVGEAWWRRDDNDELDLWWAGTGPGDYHSDPINQCNQRVTHWMPLPTAPGSKP